MEPLLMIRPPCGCCIAMSFIAAFAILQQAVTLVSITRSKSEESIVSTDAGPILMPALLNRRSNLEKRDEILSINISTSLSLVTSVGQHTTSISMPASFATSSHMSLVTVSGFGRLPANTKATFKELPSLSDHLPSMPPQQPLAKRLATARPIPEPPPVISATTQFSAVAFDTASTSFCRATPSASASLKSSQYSRIISSIAGTSGAPNAIERFESTLVGKEPTILLNRSSSSYTTLPSFDSDSGATTRCMASSSSFKDTERVGKNTVLSKPSNLST
mmetsp:Transcript_17180/g.28096  ORF Transcript_17180/g.28096 Transcript_17180/m.28096 type:complete len:277 (-) Transcript_17180:854-1684(-)